MEARRVGGGAGARPHSSTSTPSARGGGPIIGAPAIERTSEVLTEVPELVTIQVNRSLLNAVRVFLSGHANEEPVSDIEC